MKIYNLILIFTLFVPCISNDDKNREYDLISKNLSKERAGLTTEQISTVKSPFDLDSKVVAQDSFIRSNSEFILNAIIADKAKINDKWYKTGDSIDGVVIVAVLKDSVILSENNEKRVLKMTRKNDNVKLSE